jgi:hypothetical protein
MRENSHTRTKVKTHCCDFKNRKYKCVKTGSSENRVKIGYLYAFLMQLAIHVTRTSHYPDIPDIGEFTGYSLYFLLSPY